MPPKGPEEPEGNPYELLGISLEATEAEIRKAYRTRSLKVHPDRNRNDPNAAQKFHALTTASTLLLDPLRRLALDAQLRLQAAKKQRFATFDNKRKTMVTELEEREREFKRSRMAKEQENIARETENDRIREEGRRIREQREKELETLERERAKSEPEQMAGEDALAPPPLGDLDTTIRVKYALSSHSTLSTASALAAHLRRFGEIDAGSVVMSQKVKKPKKSKGQAEGDIMVTALVPFNQLGAAFGVVSSAASLKEQGMDVAWAGGSEPPILSWLRERGELGGTAPKRPKSSQTTPASDGTTFSSFPSSFPSFDEAPAPQPPPVATVGIDYESLTLLRMREAERARLEKEILEAEAAEGG
ncbi:DnaJ-domain-containing protein [Rhizopogon vinicolor AM-OR11-026]|uniref:DnaJ-domain-containing protein n=1 Tax=Rhizopogon vinicolor AM-OR11-026 TaxID=1314800 RepID=A0A1B7MJ16_9AGAM|nr:DnaJ-domain-containing protein [Rhizopogon vinicolor AM-OR11-026]